MHAQKIHLPKLIVEIQAVTNKRTRMAPQMLALLCETTTKQYDKGMLTMMMMMTMMMT